MAFNQYQRCGYHMQSIDILAVTNEERFPEALRELLNDRNVEWVQVPFDRFYRSIRDWGNIGAVLIDTTKIEKTQIKNLQQTLRYLEEKQVRALFLNNHTEISLDDYPAARLLDSQDPTDLWQNIAATIALRKLQSDEQLEEQLAPNQDQASNSEPKLPEGLSDDTVTQLKMAGQVQRNFLPTSLPSTDQIQFAAMFEPLEWVSGDIYDVTRLDEQHIGFYIADAVGHSMPAALLTMFIKQAIVMRETNGNDYRIFGPLEVVRNLNRKMAQQNLTGCLFATCCYCLLNIRTLHLSFCRGGHPYPIHIAKNGELNQMENRGSLIGVFEDAEFEQDTLQLERGDKVLVYSDGAETLIGHCDENEHFLFDEKFRSITTLPVDQMIKEFSLLAKYAKPAANLQDDITAVALEIV